MPKEEINEKLTTELKKQRGKVNMKGVPEGQSAYVYPAQDDGQRAAGPNPG